MPDHIEDRCTTLPSAAALVVDALPETASQSTRDLVVFGRFDYSGYGVAVADELRQAAVHIRARYRDAKAAIVDIGASLVRVKDNVGHGNWGNWLKAEFGRSVSSAERYMNVAREPKSLRIDR